MKVGVDFQSTQGTHRTGIGVFADNLFHAILEENPKHQFIFYKKESDGDLNVPQRIAWESLEIPDRAARDKVDLLYSPGFSPAVRSKARRLVTVHDLIGLTYPQNQTSFSTWAFPIPVCRIFPRL